MLASDMYGSCCSVLQSVAECYWSVVLQCVTVWCSLMLCVAVYFSVVAVDWRGICSCLIWMAPVAECYRVLLQSAALCYNMMLQCAAVCCSVSLQCVAAYCSDLS